MSFVDFEYFNRLQRGSPRYRRDAGLDQTSQTTAPGPELVLSGRRFARESAADASRAAMDRQQSDQTFRQDMANKRSADAQLLELTRRGVKPTPEIIERTYRSFGVKRSAVDSAADWAASARARTAGILQQSRANQAAYDKSTAERMQAEGSVPRAMIQAPGGPTRTFTGAETHVADYARGATMPTGVASEYAGLIGDVARYDTARGVRVPQEQPQGPPPGIVEALRARGVPDENMDRALEAAGYPRRQPYLPPRPITEDEIRRAMPQPVPGVQAGLTPDQQAFVRSRMEGFRVPAQPGGAPDLGAATPGPYLLGTDRGRGDAELPVPAGTAPQYGPPATSTPLGMPEAVGAPHAGGFMPAGWQVPLGGSGQGPVPAAETRFPGPPGQVDLPVAGYDATVPVRTGGWLPRFRTPADELNDAQTKLAELAKQGVQPWAAPGQGAGGAGGGARTGLEAMPPPEAERAQRILSDTRQHVLDELKAGGGSASSEAVGLAPQVAAGAAQRLGPPEPDGGFGNWNNYGRWMARIGQGQQAISTALDTAKTPADRRAFAIALDATQQVNAWREFLARVDRNEQKFGRNFARVSTGRQLAEGAIAAAGLGQGMGIMQVLRGLGLQDEGLNAADRKAVVQSIEGMRQTLRMIDDAKRRVVVPQTQTTAPAATP